MAHRLGAEAAAVRSLISALRQLQVNLVSPCVSIHTSWWPQSVTAGVANLPARLRGFQHYSATSAAEDTVSSRILAPLTCIRFSSGGFAAGPLNGATAFPSNPSMAFLAQRPGISPATSSAAVIASHLYTTMATFLPPQLLALHHHVRLKSTKSRAPGAGWGKGSGGAAAGDADTRPRRRLPRFRPSPKIMNTASLRELASLAGREVGGWSAKELAAAAKRTVVLWRREHPREAARVAAMQKTHLLGPPPPSRGRQGEQQHHQQQRGGRHGEQLQGRHWQTAAGEGADAARGAAAAAGGRVAADGLLVAGAAGAVGVVEGAAAGGTAAAVQSEVAASEGGGADGFLGAPAGGVAAPPRGRRGSGEGLGRDVTRTTRVVKTPFRSHELQLVQLVDRLVRGAHVRLAEGSLASRELSTLVWSLAALGYWRPDGVLPLLAAFLDYGGERLRGADPRAVAVVMQVMAKARAASQVGESTATRLLSLAPQATAAAAAALPRVLPSCSPHTLSGLLHSVAVLLVPAPAPPPLSPSPSSPGPSLLGSPGTPGGGGDSSSTADEDPLSGPAGVVVAEQLAGLAQDITRECVRRRFVGFGPAGLLAAAKALHSLQTQTATAGHPRLSLGSSTGSSTTSNSSEVGAAGSSSSGITSGGRGGGGGGPPPEDEASRVWRTLAAAAVSPLAPEMAGASERQWRALLQCAAAHGAINKQLLSSAAAAGVSYPELLGPQAQAQALPPAASSSSPSSPPASVQSS